jgi:hypothetical protein
MSTWNQLHHHELAEDTNYRNKVWLGGKFTANLAMSNTEGITHNTEIQMNTARKKNISSSYD